jgi:putative phosphoribosyl transferase
MMRFKNRTEAGKQLAAELAEYKGKDAVVVAIPRGGVVLGYEVAIELKAPLDVVIPRKIGAPGNPEFALGAVTEDGTNVLNEQIVESLGVSKEYVRRTIEREIAEIKRRAITYRRGFEPEPLMGRTVIIVDDGLATGATMKAAAKSMRKRCASKIVVAVPVAPPDTVKELSKDVDKIICSVIYEPFYAIGQFYDDFGQVEDDEVIRLLDLAREKLRRIN